MNATTALLSSVALLAAVGHIGARWTGRSSIAFWLKPLPIACFAAIAALASPPVSPSYRALIIAGLIFSAAGDVLLALPQDRFALGLASFLVAHLCYIAAFVGRSGFHMTPWLLAAFLFFGGLMLAFLWPSVPKQLRLPVGVHVAVILVMGWQATEQWMAVPSQSALLAMLGALLFVTSDSALAINRFGHPFRAEFVVVMTTYYLAQWLLALSVALA